MAFSFFLNVPYQKRISLIQEKLSHHLYSAKSTQFNLLGFIKREYLTGTRSSVQYEAILDQDGSVHLPLRRILLHLVRGRQGHDRARLADRTGELRGGPATLTDPM